MVPNIPSRKRIYLDVCALCRPFDDQRQMRIALETQAVHLIFSQVRQQRFELLISPAHEAEILAIRDRQERDELRLLLRQIGTSPAYNLAVAYLRTQELRQPSFPKPRRFRKAILGCGTPPQ